MNFLFWLAPLWQGCHQWSSYWSQRCEETHYGDKGYTISVEVTWNWYFWVFLGEPWSWIHSHYNMVLLKYHIIHIRTNGQSLNFWPCVFKKKGDLLKRLVNVLLLWLKIMEKMKRSVFLLLSKSGVKVLFFFVRKNAWKRIAISTRLGLERRVILFLLYILNIIWLI